MSKDNKKRVAVSVGTEDSAVKRIKQRNMQKKQRVAVIFMVIAVLALVLALFAVDYIVDIYTFEDVDGTVYYAKRVDGAYALFDGDGEMCDKSADGKYQTKLGTMVTVDAKTGECEIYAYVHTSGTEVRDYGELVLMFKQLTYDANSTKDESRVIKSIEVHNEHGSYTFERSKDRGFVIKGAENTNYNKENFAYLAVACGYTLSSRRLESPKLTENGEIDFAEYGLAAQKRWRSELDEDGNAVEVEYDYEPAWYVITTMTGESHKVIIGDKTVTGTGYYARYEGRDTIYVLGTNGIDGYLLNSLESYVVPTIVFPMRSVDYFNVRNFMIYSSIDYDKIYAELYEKYGEVNVDELDEQAKKEFDKDYARLFEQYSVKKCDFSYVGQEDRVGTLIAHSPYLNGLEYAEGYYLNSSNISLVLSSFYETKFTGVIKLHPSAEELEEYGLVNAAHIVMFYYETTDSDGKTAFAENFVQISEKSEDGVYYAYSEAYDMIVAIKADAFEFLEWEEIKWYETNYIQNDISFVDKIIVESPTFKTEFEIDDSASGYLTYLQSYGSTVSTDYKIVKDATGRYVLSKNGAAVKQIYRGDYLVMPTVYRDGVAQAEQYIFAESAEFDANEDGKNDGIMYYFYNIGYDKESKGYGLYAQVVCVDYEGNRLTEDKLIWGQVAMRTEYFATKNGFLFLASKSSQTGSYIEKTYGEKNRGNWGEGNLFVTSDSAYVIVDSKTGKWMTVDSYAQGIYFADRETSRLADRAITIPALYDESGKLKRFEETYYPKTDKKLIFNEDTGRIMAYNRNKGTYQDIAQSECSIGVWNEGAYYMLDNGRLVVVNEMTGEWGYLSVVQNSNYVANVFADGELLDYSLPYVTETGKNSEKTAMENFQQFYKALLVASFEGMAELSDEDKAALSKLDDFSLDAENNPCELKITVLTTDLKGNTRDVVYRFYRISERKSYITVEVLDEDGQSSSDKAYGSFYVLHSFVQKIIEDAERVVGGEIVDATSKY